MGTQSQQAQAQLGMFGAMSRTGGGAGNATLLQKAGNSQNPMLLKVSTPSWLPNQIKINLFIHY